VRSAIHIRRRQAAVVVAVLLVTLYGVLLRLDAYTGEYGALAHPAWARFMTHDVAPLARYVRPPGIRWGLIAAPYVGGDPINYLKFAREMTSFYQPHVREPVFLAMTRTASAILDRQDAAVSLASAVGSVLAIIATYLLGAALISPLGGLAAALIMAIEYDMITWAVDGWRDDMFTAMVTLSAWTFVRFHDRPSFANGVLVGIITGLACLTRITALSFVLPALVWVAVARGKESRREGVGHAATALLILTAVVSPYLISCAIATGDPFYAINYHTVYYRFAEGMPIGAAMTAGDYLRLKFAGHPIGTLDTAFTGEFIRPFITKWRGIDPWSPYVAELLRWLSLTGLLALPFSSKGRLLTVILLGSLIPYAFTWNVGAGGEWRFTMHAYPIYLVAAMMAARGVYRGLRTLVRGRFAWRAAIGPIGRRAVVSIAIAAGASALYAALPWFVVREAVSKRESVSLEPDARGRVFYRSGWSPPHDEGLATVRVSRAVRAQMHFPLTEKRAHHVVLRLDPVDPARQKRLMVLFNQQVVGNFGFVWDPQRVGSYQVSLPPEWVRVGDNEIIMVVQPVVAAGAAGPRFAWLDPHEEVGIRLWYVRVLD